MRKRQTYEKPNLTTIQLADTACPLLADSDIDTSSQIDPWGEGNSDEGDVDF